MPTLLKRLGIVILSELSESKDLWFIELQGRIQRSFDCAQDDGLLGVSLTAKDPLSYSMVVFLSSIYFSIAIVPSLKK